MVNTGIGSDTFALVDIVDFSVRRYSDKQTLLRCTYGKEAKLSNESSELEITGGN